MGMKTVWEQTCCFTGHRKIRNDQKAELSRRLDASIRALIAEDYRYFCTGGALGFDTMAAQAVLALRAAHPEIRLILVLPCLSQTKGWPEADKAAYQRILEQANDVVYVSQEYTRNCMFQRNRALVDRSSVCICYLTRQSGGTAYTVNYAQQKGLRICNAAEP